MTFYPQYSCVLSAILGHFKFLVCSSGIIIKIQGHLDVIFMVRSEKLHFQRKRQISLPFLRHGLHLDVGVHLAKALMLMDFHFGRSQVNDLSASSDLEIHLVPFHFIRI